MRKPLFLLTLSVVCGAQAQTVSVNEATQVARAFMAAHMPQLKASAGRASVAHEPELAYTAQAGGDVHCYVFNAGGNDGFVIVGGDQRARQILGYSTSGRFDYDHVPANLRWWLTQMELQIEEAASGASEMSGDDGEATEVGGDVADGSYSAFPARHDAASTYVRRAASRMSITPMLTTRWDQGSPFNNALPSLGAEYGGDYMLATGCVATAMAQVMNYYRHPSQGAGDAVSYSTGDVTVGADFAATTYQWDDMLDSYDARYTARQANAVATLMYHCGVAVGMRYRQILMGGSSAASRDIPEALFSHFGYDRSAYLASRIYYNDQDWEDLIYSELEAHRPVIYSGRTDAGSGHAFVCDGYASSTQTYHINWGWGGYCDGYFALSGTQALAPKGSGVGGAGRDASYTADQCAVVGIQPNAGGDYHYSLANSVPYSLYVGSDNPQPVTEVTVSKSAPKTFTLECQPIVTSSVRTTYQVGYILEDPVSGYSVAGTSDDEESTLDPNYYYTNFTRRTFSSLILTYIGTYNVYPAYRIAGSKDWVKMDVPTSYVVPKIQFTDGLAPTPKDITFSIDRTTVAERSTLKISHDKTYTGSVSYTSSNPAVASVNANGLVKGVKTGRATITASGTSTLYYKATTQRFDVTVSDFIKVPVLFELADSTLNVGDVQTIKHTAAGYSGSISYTSDNAKVASVDAEGNITALSTGTALITVRATDDDTYLATTRTFTIVVMQPGVLLKSYSIAQHGYLTFSDLKVKARFLNNSGTNLSNYVIYCLLSLPYLELTFGVTINNWRSGSDIDYTFDFSSQPAYAMYLASYVGQSGTFTLLESDKQTLIVEPIPFTLCEAQTIRFSMPGSGYETLCLPFDAVVPAGLNAYTCQTVLGGVLSMRAVDTLMMNMPCLVTGTPGAYSFTGPVTPHASDTYTEGVLTGILTDDYSLGHGEYVLQERGDDVGFFPVSESLVGTKARQYSCLMGLEITGMLEQQPLMLVSGIDEVRADVSAPSGVYDLLGRRLPSVGQGLQVVREADGTTHCFYIATH